MSSKRAQLKLRVGLLKRWLAIHKHCVTYHGGVGCGVIRQNYRKWKKATSLRYVSSMYLTRAFDLSVGYPHHVLRVFFIFWEPKIGVKNTYHFGQSSWAGLLTPKISASNFFGVEASGAGHFSRLGTPIFFQKTISCRGTQFISSRLWCG